MRIYAETDRKLVGMGTPDGWDVLLCPSDTSDRMYRIDITHGRCSCPGWVNKKDPKLPCKHLKELGFKPVFKHSGIAEPIKAKAKSKVAVKTHYGS